MKHNRLGVLWLVLFGVCLSDELYVSHAQREFTFPLIPVPPNQQKFLKVSSLRLGETEIEKNVEMELTVMSNHIHLQSPLYDRVVTAMNNLDPDNIHCWSVRREIVDGIICKVSKQIWKYLQKNDTTWLVNGKSKDMSFVLGVSQDINIKVEIKQLLKSCTIIHVGRIGYNLKSDNSGSGRIRAERVCYSRFYRSNNNMISTEFINRKSNAEYANKMSAFIRTVDIPLSANVSPAPKHLSQIPVTPAKTKVRHHRHRGSKVSLTSDGYPYQDDFESEQVEVGTPTPSEYAVFSGSHNLQYFFISPMYLPGSQNMLWLTEPNQMPPKGEPRKRPLTLPNKVTGMFFVTVESELEYFIQVLFGIDVMLLCIISAFMWNSRFDIARSGGLRALVN